MVTVARGGSTGGGENATSGPQGFHVKIIPTHKDFRGMTNCPLALHSKRGTSCISLPLIILSPKSEFVRTCFNQD